MRCPERQCLPWRCARILTPYEVGQPPECKDICGRRRARGGGGSLVDAVHKAPNTQPSMLGSASGLKPRQKEGLGGGLLASLRRPPPPNCSSSWRPDLWKRNNRWMIEEFDRRGDTLIGRTSTWKITKIAYTQGVFAWVKRVWFPLRALTKPTPREPLAD